MIMMRTQSLDQLEVDIMLHLSNAENYFKKVNHLRGLAQTYKGMREEMREKSYKLKVAQLPQVKEFDAKYTEHVQMFRKACDETRDLCISRIPGEDFSLNVEVVRAWKVKALFDKYEAP